MTAAEIGKLLIDTGLGGISLALFFRLGKVVADHEIRISSLEGYRVRNPDRGRIRPGGRRGGRVRAILPGTGEGGRGGRFGRRPDR